MVTRRLLDAIARTHRLSTRLHAESARSLSQLHAAEAHRKLGFPSFGDFSRETLGLAHGTVKDRLKLHEVLSASRRIATSFARGELSESKAIVLLPVVRLGLSDEAAEQWLAVSREMSVRQLRCAVREALRTMNAAVDPEAEDAGEDGRIVSFRGPVPVARMFEDAIETARKVLGTHAPRYACVEALLAETSSEWQRLEPDLEERLEQRTVEVPGPIAVHVAPHRPSPDPKPAVEVILVPRSNPALLMSALRMAERVEREVAEIEGLVGMDVPTSAVPTRHERTTTIQSMAGPTAPTPDTSPLSGLAIEDPISPSSPVSATLSLPDLQSQIDRVVALEQLDAPLRIYRAELLRDLRDTGAMASLGYSSWANFAQDHLGLSERATRSLVAEGRLFATEAGLRDAYGRGELPLGKAFLLRRIAGSGRVTEAIDRASAVTHLQLAREVRLIEWARQVGARLSLSRSAEEMEEALMLSLSRWGWTRPRVRGLLETVGLTRPATGDPATDPGSMNRLERLIDLLILTIWDEPPQGNENQGHGDQGDQNPDDDRRTSTHANATMEVRFWAPDPIAQDWKTALGRIRERNGIGCPPWVAVSMLIAEAMQEWERQDPKRIPTEAKILSRDGYRCMVPGCSSRRGLEVHHLEFLSAGGSDEDWNKAPMCHGHHRMLHEGVIRVWGRAPHDLYWEIGCQPDGPPLMRLKGNRIISKSFGR